MENVSGAPIGVFDSGVGGLTVVKRLLDAMPNEKIVYFGDTKRVPYGDRPPETIKRFTFEITDFLMGKGVKAVVIACNTITAVCLDELRARLDVPVFGILEPAVNAVKNAGNVKTVAVIGTKRTVESGQYKEMLQREMPDISVLEKACPMFVHIVEDGFLTGELPRLAAAHYLSEFDGKNIDAVVLGCTHYPLLYGVIKEAVGGGVKIIDPAVELANNVKLYLKENGIENKSGQACPPCFYVSELANFPAISELALGKRYMPETVCLQM